LYRENVWWTQTGNGFNSEQHSRNGTDFSFSDVAQKIIASYW
jgi:hypothetical protein